MTHHRSASPVRVTEVSRETLEPTATTGSLFLPGSIAMLDVPMFLERVDFAGAFPRSREPRAAYLHVANDDGPQWPTFGRSLAERLLIGAASIMGGLALAAALVGILALR